MIRMSLTKICSKCREEKPLEGFYRDSQRKDGYRPSCKSCKDKDQKKSFCPTTQKQRNRLYYQHTKERQKTYGKRWYKENKERRSVTQKLWEKSNKAARKRIKAKYRAQLLQAMPPWLSQDQLEQIEKAYQEATQLSGKTGLTYHVDHIVPLQGKTVCGLHVPWNLQVITSSENHSKFNIFNGGW